VASLFMPRLTACAVGLLSRSRPHVFPFRAGVESALRKKGLSFSRVYSGERPPSLGFLGYPPQQNPRSFSTDLLSGVQLHAPSGSPPGLLMS